MHGDMSVREIVHLDPDTFVVSCHNCGTVGVVQFDSYTDAYGVAVKGSARKCRTCDTSKTTRITRIQ